MRLVLVTGAGRGIGRAIALKLAQSGYLVQGCARTQAELFETSKLAGGKIETSVVDVADAVALTQWVDHCCAAKGSVPWGLVTAAGIYGPIGPFVGNAWEEWRKSIEVNLYGTAVAAGVFARTLLERKIEGRIVLLSGGGATQAMPNFTSYCASKSAVVRFGETLAGELHGSGITVNSVAPGAVNTRLMTDVIAAGPAKAGKEMYERARAQKEGGGGDPTKAAELTEYLLSDAAAEVTGRLISAVWDPWPTLHQKPGVLSSEDMYTLRRVVPPEKKK